MSPGFADVTDQGDVFGLSNTTDGTNFIAEVFNTFALVDDETSMIAVTKAPKLYFGRMRLPAFIAFCVFIPLLFIITAVNCYWDFEYERCAVEPADEKTLLVSTTTSGGSKSDNQVKMPTKSKEASGSTRAASKAAKTTRGAGGVVAIEVDETQCTSPAEETPLITMDFTQQVSEAEITRQKRKKMVAAAYSISTSRSERVHEDGTQDDSTSETGVSPDSAYPSSKSGRHIVGTKTKSPETRTKTPETKTKTPLDVKKQMPDVKK